MKTKTLWLVVSCLMALSLVMAACTTPAASTTPPTQTPAKTSSATTTPTTPINPTIPAIEPSQKPPVTPSPQIPKYGGTLNFALNNDPTRTFDPIVNITGRQIDAVFEQLWAGDWARGRAGGYGTGETDWGMGNNDIFEYKMGFFTEGTKWTLDEAKNVGIIVYQVRPGVHYALNPNSEASRLVNGRSTTADDLVTIIKRATTETRAYLYTTNIELRSTNVTKTGPMEVTVTVPLASLMTAIVRFGDSLYTYPPEVPAKYGTMDSWKNSVGTGAFMITDYIPGSQITYIKSPNYWMTDPVGPGKGKQLPYIDGLRLVIITDASTRLAAMRTAKIDHISALTMEDATALRKQNPALLEQVSTSQHGRGTPLFMRTDKAPFSDIRVRKAMMMSIDFKSILANYRNGSGQILTYPCSKINPYEMLYLDLDAPDFPESAKELYEYHPDRSLRLLKEAGFPNGFKTEILITSTEVDYYSIIKDYFLKVGIDMTLDVRETQTKANITRPRTHNAMSTATTGPIAQFLSGFSISGVSEYNLSMVDDPIINKALEKARLVALTDQFEAMRIYREEIFKYIVTQAYAIPDVIGSTHKFWWPWIKNYSGEEAVGYDDYNWQQWVWIDQDLKKSMGY